MAADPLQHLESVDVGQAEVQNDQVDVVGQGDSDRSGAGGFGPGGVAGCSQSFGDEDRNTGFVFDDQDLGHRVPLGAAGLGRRGRTRVNVLPRPGVESMVMCP